jgi:hypothetical protein
MLNSENYFNGKENVMKLKEVTPSAFVCHSASCCPAVFETENNSYVIIGKKLSVSAEAQLAGRIGADEFAIEVPKGMIDGVK